MYEWYTIHPAYQAHLVRAHDEHAEAMSRAAYLLVVGFDWLVARAARALVAGLRQISRAYDRGRRRRHTIQALARLDDRLLRDIGILPGDIEAIAAELTGAAEPAPTPAPATSAAAATAVPRLRLDLDCPDLKHAA